MVNSSKPIKRLAVESEVGGLFPGFYLHRYRLVFRALEAVRLPLFVGSTLRGVLGHALRAVDEQAYYEFFEPRLPEHHPDARRLIPPPAYVVRVPTPIQPGNRQERRLNEGDFLDAELILFGRANEQLTTWIQAFSVAPNLGMGVKQYAGSVTERFRLMLISIVELGLPGDVPRSLAKADKPYYPINSSRLRVSADRQKLQSIALRWNQFPHIEVNGGFPDSLPLSLVVPRLWMRLQALNRQYGDGTDLTIPEPIARALPQIHTYSQHLTWHTVERYSNRQGRSHSLAGWQGTLQYAGDWQTVLPVLALGQFVGVGHMAAMGLGWYEIL